MALVQILGNVLKSFKAVPIFMVITVYKITWCTFTHFSRCYIHVSIRKLNISSLEIHKKVTNNGSNNTNKIMMKMMMMMLMRTTSTAVTTTMMMMMMMMMTKLVHEIKWNITGRIFGFLSSSIHHFLSLLFCNDKAILTNTPQNWWFTEK